MSPVLRIDDEVWEWLKRQAEPFEDTPNSVLRRVAGIDPPRRAAITSPAQPIQPATTRPPSSVEDIVPPAPATKSLPRLGKRVTGEGLNRAFNLGARHALYHKDGTFFERLVMFPGILCDPKGYVRFESEAQFLGDSSLNIGEKVNVPRGLWSHPRYTRFPVAEPK